jgi:hypothetical protein
MNHFHPQFPASAEWAAMLEADLGPWLASAIDLGDDVLKVGSGLTTDLLRRRTIQITCVEVDEPLAPVLSDRLFGTTVEVIHGDATNSRPIGSQR